LIPAAVAATEAAAILLFVSEEERGGLKSFDILIYLLRKKDEKFILL
jgi:hypothetical protein